MTETDADGVHDVGPVELPGGSHFDAPPPARRDTRAPEIEYEMVETDPSPAPQPEEDRLTEQQAGERPLVQSAEANEGRPPRRFRTKSEENAARRAGRDRTMAELAAARAEIDELNRRLGGIEPRLTEIDESRLQSRIGDIDRRIQDSQHQVAEARRKMSEAMISSDADALNSALEARDAAIMAQSRLTAEKNLLTTGNPLGEGMPRLPARPPGPQIQPPPQVQPLPARAREFIADFEADNDWMRRDAQGRALDFDTNLALQLDNAVAAEGFNPSTQDYWDELQSRIDRYLPHRAAGSSAAPAKAPQQAPRQMQVQPERRGPMVGGAGDRAPAARPNQVYISPERKESLIQAGILERDGRTVANKDKFNRVMRSYQEFDRSNGAARQ